LGFNVKFAPVQELSIVAVTMKLCGNWGGRQK